MPEMRRYLVVDDNLPFAENLAEILISTGADVDVASAGPDALKRAAYTRYDALVSDMRMPLMGGAELVHRMRQIDPGLPAVVITAYTNDDDLSAARDQGLLAVLPKPAPIDRLIALLASARRDGIVVVVEDNPSLLDNLTEALRAQGFATVTAETVLETEHLEKIKPFAALVDLRVPVGPDGAAMSQLARRFPGIPMLAVTAHSDQPLPEKCEEIFTKPFSSDKLMEAVERLYLRRRG